MSTTPDRDRDVEQLLRQVMPARAASTNDCLDAESLAAWVADGLGVDARAAAEAHVAGCTRCQAVLTAIVRSEPEVTAPRPWWRVSIVRWMAPALVTVGAAMLWFLLPQQSQVAPAVVPEGERPREAAATRGAPGVAAGDVAPRDQRAPAEIRERPSAAAPPPAPPQPVAVPATTATADAMDDARLRAPMRERAPLDVASPHPGERWRVVASAIDYTTDNGVTWERLDVSLDAMPTAGMSSSRSVCWLVGRGGTVLLTVDGRRWREVAFPESVDLVAVDARDALTATVTTGDGRVFTTNDGGAGWQPR